MRLSALSVDGFGLFAGRFACRFPGEIALVVGGNETGKSTIVAAIGAILFGFGNEIEKAAFAPIQADGPGCGSLEVESAERKHRISRDFRTNKVKVELLEESPRILFEGVAKPAGRGDEKEKYNKLLARIFGIETRELFYNSILVEQGKLPAEMEPVVRRIVSGGSSADYAIVLDNMKELCEQLTVSVRWGRAASRKPRRIEQLGKEIEEKKRLLKENTDVAGMLNRLRERVSALDEKLRETQDSQKEKADWQKKLQAFSTACSRKIAAEEQLNRIRKEKGDIHTLKQEIQRIEAEIKNDFKAYLGFPEVAEQELAGLAASRRTIEELQQPREQTLQAAPAFKLPRVAPAAVVAGVFFVTIGIIFLDGLTAALAVLAGIAAAAYPFLSAAAALHSERSAQRCKLDEIDDRLRAQLQQQQEREKKYPILATTDIEDVLNRLRLLRRLQAEREKKQEALKQHRAEEEIEAEFNRFSNELLMASRQLDPLKEEHPRLADFEREGKIGHALEEIKKEMARIETSCRSLTQEKEDVRYQLAGAEAREVLSEEILEEEIQQMQAELERLKQYRDAYLKAVDVLDEAISEFRSSHLARIEEKTSEYLSTITGNPLRVCLGEKLEPLYVENGEQRLQPQQLSRGAHDQLCFSLRLAAIGEICDNIHLPIVLDDPFVNFDERRLRETQKMLEALSASHQIILLTHDRRYCDWRAPVVVLDNSEGRS